MVLARVLGRLRADHVHARARRTCAIGGSTNELAYEAGIRYADSFAVQDTAGREWRRDERCILFPFRDRAGQVVAINVRFIDVPSSDQKRKTVTLGPRNSRRRHGLRPAEA